MGEKQSLKEVINTTFSYHMNKYEGRKSCCVCGRNARWHRPGVGVFCSKHKREYQEEYKRLTRSDDEKSTGEFQLGL